ncbi:hypothetical protein BCR36DRAFT_448441 [Piromyces finnis]|uniref:BZIP domain-containing protein n=1 Tax=Piromyces finnis TaxID=1754191 RepID=A0A1Y1VAZ1_9FUNG|nr:hypothetical protein BCR36DRAFT_448441 [Piromyces finnis]|eukprot:ORX50677.1 hypothetical protein BCR36DRAFT_448441 [Piromyces finnis]
MKRRSSQESSMSNSAHLYGDNNFLNNYTNPNDFLFDNQFKSLFVKGKLDNMINSPDISQRKRGRKKKVVSNDNANNNQEKENKKKLLLEKNNTVKNSENPDSNNTKDQSSLPKVKDSSYFIEKRKRNTEASARFRARKKQKEQSINNLCQKLDIENKKLKYHLLLSDKKIKWLEELLLEKSKLGKETQENSNKNLNNIMETNHNYSFLPMNNSFNYNYGNEYQEMNINFKTLSPTKSNNNINEKFNSFLTNTPIQGLAPNIFNPSLLKNKSYESMKKPNPWQDMNNPFLDKKGIDDNIQFNMNESLFKKPDFLMNLFNNSNGNNNKQDEDKRKKKKNSNTPSMSNMNSTSSTPNKQKSKDISQLNPTEININNLSSPSTSLYNPIHDGNNTTNLSNFDYEQYYQQQFQMQFQLQLQLQLQQLQNEQLLLQQYHQQQLPQENTPLSTMNLSSPFSLIPNTAFNNNHHHDNNTNDNYKSNTTNNNNYPLDNDSNNKSNTINDNNSSNNINNNDADDNIKNKRNEDNNNTGSTSPLMTFSSPTLSSNSFLPLMMSNFNSELMNFTQKTPEKEKPGNSTKDTTNENSHRTIKIKTERKREDHDSTQDQTSFLDYQFSTPSTSKNIKTSLDSLFQTDLQELMENKYINLSPSNKISTTATLKNEKSLSPESITIKKD